MTLFKQKSTIKPVGLTVKIVAILALVSQIAIPGVALAKISENNDLLAHISETDELTLKESPAGHLFYPDLKAVNDADLVINAVITAYTSTVDQCDDDPFIAATGKRVYDGMIAANGLPFGTKIKIPSLYGDKIFTVDDRMNARYGFGRMDIWLDSTKTDARKFGVKRVEVEIYYPDAPTKELARK